MADLFKKNAPVEDAAPVAVDANADAPAPEAKGKKEKKSKVKYLEPNQMNFLEQYSIVVEGKKKNLDLQKVLKPLIAVAILVLAVFVLLEVLLIGMKAQTKSLDKFINDESNVASYNEALTTKEKTDAIRLQKANIEATIAAIDSYPNVGKDFFDTIEKTATKDKVEIESYTYANESGYLDIQCASSAISPATTGISQFVRDLGTLGLFDSISYYSFSGSEDGGYRFNVTAVCKGDENAPVVEETPTEEVTEG